MKTKGALLWGQNEPWTIEGIEIGDPRHGEVKVQVEAAGICHSDHHLVTGAMPMPAYPILGGHEGAGIVTEVGPGVDRYAVGDHIVFSFIPACGHCPACQDGLRNLCDLGAGLLMGASISDGSFRIQARGNNAYPMSLLGTFSPFAVVHQDSIVKIDPSIPFEVACLVGCGVTTGYGSAVHSADIRPGEDVAVIGIGGVGAAALQGARAAGARTIVAIDPVEWKREQAIKFGATHTFPTVADSIQPIVDLTLGRMCHKVIVTAGDVQGHEVDTWMSITGKAGCCVMTGVGNLLDSQVTLNLAMLTLLQKTLRGSIFGGANPQVDIPTLLSLYKTKQLDLDSMVTRTYRLEQVNEAFDDMLGGRNIRGVIRYTDDDR
ncbi:NDMA-dependent alcohol dehydrogenase [Gordonia sp. NPDC058843]|uniref:NDMA-dependent alcohol dehydrogenase n=1 Tax=Gordonia sp. NPDC058843 TaxID=3346648 RepID=UPI0036A55DC5